MTELGATSLGKGRISVDYDGYGKIRFVAGTNMMDLVYDWS